MNENDKINELIALNKISPLLSDVPAPAPKYPDNQILDWLQANLSNITLQGRNLIDVACLPFHRDSPAGNRITVYGQQFEGADLREAFCEAMSAAGVVPERAPRFRGSGTALDFESELSYLNELEKGTS